MSFRRARDATFIAQLVGRMVRTPLASRVDSDEVLNSVALYLPKYDRGAVQAIIRTLRAGDPDYVPSLEAEEGDGLVTCERREDLHSRIDSAARRLRTFVVPRARRMAPVTRLERLAGSLSDFDLLPDAPQLMEDALVGVLWARLSSRLGQDEFVRAVERSRQVELTSTTLSYLTGQTETGTIQVQSTSRSLDRVYEQVGIKTGAGLHDKLWRRIREDDSSVDGETARLYVIATLGQGAARDALDAEARQLFEQWLNSCQDEVDELAEHERQEIERLRAHAEAPTAVRLRFP